MAGAWPHLLWSRMPSTRGSYVAGCDVAHSVVRDSIGRVLLGGCRGGGQGHTRRHVRDMRIIQLFWQFVLVETFPFVGTCAHHRQAPYPRPRSIFQKRKSRVVCLYPERVFGMRTFDKSIQPSP